MLLNYFRFRSIADMAGLAAGSTRSRMTQLRHFAVRDLMGSDAASQLA
jgi:hypothetical protein